MSLSHVVDLAEAPGGESTYKAFLDDLCDRLGFDYAAYTGINPLAGSVHGYVNYSNAWKAHYVEQGYQAVDPTLFIGMRSVAAFDWRRIDQDEGFRRVFRDATDFGITERGFSVPVRGPMGDVGLLSVTKKCSNLRWDSLVERNVGALQVTASRMHETVMRSDKLNAMLRRMPLSTREREILTWAARGKSPAAIASILAIGTRTVEMILGSVFQKLNVVNVNPAVDEAAALGLLTTS